MFRRGNVWWTCIRHEGRKINESLGTSDKKLAKEIEAKIRVKIAERKHLETHPGDEITVAELMERLLSEHAPKVSIGMQVRYKDMLKRLLPHFGSMKLNEVRPRHISAYKQMRLEKGKRPATVNREISCLSKAFSLAVKEWEWAKENPCSKVSKERENNIRDRWLTSEEEAALLAQCNGWLREIVLFALHTGMRQDEILSLEWQQVDLFRKTAVLYRGTTKNREPKTMPLNNTAFELLKAKAKTRAIHISKVFPSVTGEKVCKAYLGKVFRAAMKKAGIKNFRFHDLRHTFASRLAQQGVDIYLIARLLGQKTLAVTMRYAHHSAESLRKGVELLDAAQVDYNLTTVGGGSGIAVGKAID